MKRLSTALWCFTGGFFLPMRAWRTCLIEPTSTKRVISMLSLPFVLFGVFLYLGIAFYIQLDGGTIFAALLYRTVFWSGILFISGYIVWLVANGLGQDHVTYATSLTTVSFAAVPVIIAMSVSKTAIGMILFFPMILYAPILFFRALGFFIPITSLKKRLLLFALSTICIVLAAYILGIYLSAVIEASKAIFYTIVAAVKGELQ